MASHYYHWDKEDEKWLYENYVKLGAKECSRQLRRSYGSVVAKYTKLYEKEMKRGKRV